MLNMGTVDNTPLVATYPYTVTDAIECYDIAQNSHRVANPGMPQNWDDMTEQLQNEYLKEMRRLLQQKLEEIDLVDMAMDALYRVECQQNLY